jgi:putative ABC transport system permease protein
VDLTAMRLLPPLARLNLLHNKVRTLVAVAGICFAVTLLFMQLGFFASVLKTAVLVYDGLDFDLLISSPNYVVLTQAEAFPRARLHQAEGHPDVRAVLPVYVSRVLWRNKDTRYRRAVVMLGVNPNDPVSRAPELAGQLPGLARPDTVLVDRLSRPECGPHEVGDVTDAGTEAGTYRLTVVGQFTVGPGFEAGLVVVGDQTFCRLQGGRPLADVNLGLVQLRPGVDPERARAELKRRLPRDVEVLTRSGVARREWRYWVTSTSTGIIFGTGVLVALLFGLVITYQVLSMEVSQRLSEYATLKALGFADATLSRVVLQQALILGAVSYVPGFAFACGIYRFGESATNLPVGMTLGRAVAVAALNLVVCGASGLMALRILRRADPVDLF